MKSLSLRLATAVLLAFEGTAVAQFQFASRVDLSLRGAPQVGVVAHVNEDTLPDALIGTDQGLAVMLGQKGSMVRAPRFTSTDRPVTALASGDIDGDGHVDVVYASASRQAILRFGVGDGSFGPAHTIALQSRPYSLHAADVDGDRRIDIVVGTADGIEVLHNTGRNRLASTGLTRTEFIVRVFAIADFTGDGQIDLALFDSDTTRLQVLAGRGDGRFELLGTARGGLGVRRAVPHDFDRDGRADLVVIEDSGVSLLTSDGQGGFTPSVLAKQGDLRSFTLGDFTKNGDTDLVTIDSRRCVLTVVPHVNGKFVVGASYSIGLGPIDVLAADFDGDGLTDLLSLNQRSDSVTWLGGKPNGRFAAVPILDAGPAPVAVSVADLNRDGNLDLAVANDSTNAVHILLGDGTGNLLPHAIVHSGREPRALAIADFDGDHVLDIATANFAGDSVAVCRGQGSGNFDAPTMYSAGLGPTAIAAADLNGDDAVDLVVANKMSNSISLLLGNGRGGFAAATNFPVIKRPGFLMAGDMDGDLRTDLVVGSAEGQAVSILKGTPQGLGAPTIDDLGSKVWPLLSDDFNRDGRIDLVVPDESLDRIKLLPGAGGNSFEHPIQIPVGRDPTAAAAGDFNHDRHIDLIVLHRASHTVMLLLNRDAEPGDPAPVGPPPTPSVTRTTVAWEQTPIRAWETSPTPESAPIH